MAANALTRDQILLEALKMAEVPSLNQQDVSNGNPHTGTINVAAMSIGMLQQGLNLFYSQFPWQATATSAAIAFVANVNTVALPARFMLDVRDGVLVTVGVRVRRLRRRGLQNLISYNLNARPGAPVMYCLQADQLLIAPTPDIAYTGTIWFYQRPADLTGSAIPVFPSDLILIEYVRIRALELTRQVPPGSALRYARAEILEMRKGGLAGEPENEDIPFDPTVFIPGAGQGYDGSSSWMGETTR